MVDLRLAALVVRPRAMVTVVVPAIVVSAITNFMRSHLLLLIYRRAFSGRRSNKSTEICT